MGNGELTDVLGLLLSLHYQVFQSNHGSLLSSGLTLGNRVVGLGICGNLADLALSGGGAEGEGEGEGEGKAGNGDTTASGGTRSGLWGTSSDQRSEDRAQKRPQKRKVADNGGQRESCKDVADDWEAAEKTTGTTGGEDSSELRKLSGQLSDESPLLS